MADISATEAARNFSRVLDDIERRGRSFTIHRGGRPVASVGPAGPRSMRVGELLERLRFAPRLDDAYADDLRRLRQSAGTPPAGSAWDS